MSVVKAWLWLKSSINTTMGLIDSREGVGGWVDLLRERECMLERERGREVCF